MTSQLCDIVLSENVELVLGVVDKRDLCLELIYLVLIFVDLALVD